MPSWADEGRLRVDKGAAASSAADAWWEVKLTASRPKQNPLAMIAANERWCGIIAKGRRPILFLFVVII